MHLRTIQNIFFFGLLLIATLAFLGLLQDFWLPLFWAAVLAIIFYPVQLRWERTLRGWSSLASVLTILTIVLIVILPLFLVGMAVSQEAVALYDRIATGELDVRKPIELARRSAPIVTDYLDRFGIDSQRIIDGLSGAAVTASSFLASRALEVGQNALRFSILFFLMLYILFFFLRDGERLLETIIGVLPLGDRRERRLFAKFAEVTRATIKGTMVVGIVQGALGGLLFWILGIPAPVLWGVIMTVLSFLPAVGAAVVWVPAAIILLVTGYIVKAIVLTVAGTLIISLVDNILRPILVGRDTQMPDFLILLSTLGGLTVFGLSGFVLGPIIAALFLVLWGMLGQEYGNWDNVEAVKEAAQPEAEAPPPEPKEAEV